MAFDREVRTLGGIKGFLDRLRRRQYIGEVAQNTKDALEGHIKKIRAEKHVVWVTNHLADNVEAITLNGSESLFEPDGNEVKLFNTFEEPLAAQRSYLRMMAGVVYECITIPDPWAVASIKYLGRKTFYCTDTFTGIQFDGNGDWVDCGSDVTLWSQALTKFSFSFWMIPFTIGDGNFKGLVNHGNYAANGFSVWMEAAGTEINFDVFGTVAGEQNARGHLEKGALVPYFITCVYDRTLANANVKIYVDGVLSAETADMTDTINNAVDSLFLGTDGSDFNGVMWDFKWFTTRALTQQQVTDTMNNSMQAPIPDYWLPMNSFIDDPIDIVSQTKKGTMTGSDYSMDDDFRQDFIWIANTMTFGTVPTILSTGYSVGLNITTTDPYGNTIKRKNQFLTITQEDRFEPFSTFNGIDQFISEADKASLDLTVFTVSIKFRTSGNPGGGSVGYLINKGDYINGGAGQNHNYGIYIVNATGQIFGEFQTNTSIQHVVGGKKVDDGKWHTVTLRYDGTELEIFVDGQLVDSEVTSDVPDNATADPLVIGRFSGSSQLFYKGDLSDAVVWNNAVTDEEIQFIHYGYSLPNEAGIVYYHGLNSTSFDGIDDFTEQVDAAPLRLTQFSVAVKFKSLSHHLSDDGCLLGKGGFGSDTAGQNDNYSLRMMNGANDGKIRGGFEEGVGTDHYATSPLRYNDGEWHIAIVTYDQVTIRLYIDGIEVATHATTTTPESVNTNPLRIGANPRGLNTFFRGDVEYAYVWNNDLTVTEIQDFVRNQTLPQTGAIVYSNILRQPSTDNLTQPVVITHEQDFYWIRQNFTESIWFYAQDLSDSGADRVLKINTFDDNNYHSYMIDNADNKLFIEFVKGGVATRLESTVAVTANAFHHLVVTWSHSTPTIAARLDDVAMTSSAKVGHAAIAWHKPCYGGYPRMMYHEQLMGLIDVHMYYKHDTVLTTGEMTNVKNNNSKYAMSGGRVPCISGAVMSAP